MVLGLAVAPGSRTLVVVDSADESVASSAVVADATTASEVLDDPDVVLAFVLEVVAARVVGGVDELEAGTSTVASAAPSSLAMAEALPSTVMSDASLPPPTNGRRNTPTACRTANSSTTASAANTGATGSVTPPMMRRDPSEKSDRLPFDIRHPFAGKWQVTERR